MKINDYALACKSSSLLKLYLANFKKEGMDKVVNYKRNAMLLEVPEAARAKALEEINDAIEDELTDILYDYISEEGKVQFDKLSEDLLESKIMDGKSKRPISPLKGRKKREYEQSESQYGEFYSNTWNLMGKYIMLTKAEKGTYAKHVTQKLVKARLVNEYSKGMFILGEQRTGKTTYLKHLAVQLAMAGITVVFFDPQGEQQFHVYREDYEEYLKSMGWRYSFPGKYHKDQDISKCAITLDASKIRFHPNDVNPMQLIYLSHKMVYEMSRREQEVLETIYNSLMDRYIRQYGDDVDPPNHVVANTIESLDGDVDLRPYGLTDKDREHALRLKNRLSAMQKKIKTSTSDYLKVEDICKPHTFILEDKGQQKKIKWGKIVVVDCSTLGDLGTTQVQGKVQMIAYNIMNMIFKKRQEARLRVFQMEKQGRSAKIGYQFEIFPRVAIIIDEAQNYLSSYDDAVSKAYLANIQMGDKNSVGIIGVFRATGNIPPMIMNEARKFLVFRTGITAKGDERFMNKFLAEGYNEDFRSFMGSKLSMGEYVLFGIDDLIVQGGRDVMGVPLVVKAPPSPFKDLRDAKDKFIDKSQQYDWS